MLAFDFDYYLPDTVKEATEIYNQLQSQGKKPFYYAGGTEILSMGRVFNIKPDAVIDIKKIPECRETGMDGEYLTFGSAETLHTIRESGLYPLLSLAAGRIADHTIQCKLTLGGNLAGTIIYHETLLPFLLADGIVTIANSKGLRQEPISKSFSPGKGLLPGDLILKVKIEKKFAEIPYAHIKKTKIEKIGYPLISLSALNANGTMRLASSGLCMYPFRFKDAAINTSEPAGNIAMELSHSAPATVLDDQEGTAGYRRFIFTKTVEKMINEFRVG